jgi:hypothetical protein
MADFNLLAATRSIEKSMPFVLYRWLVYLGVSFALLFATLVSAGTFIAFASFLPKPGSVAGFGALVGFLGLIYGFYRFRGSLFFNVNAGQLALMAEQERGGKIPDGFAQVEFAKSRADARFNSAQFHHYISEIGAVLTEDFLKNCGYFSPGSFPYRISALLSQGLLGTSIRALAAQDFLRAAGDPWKNASDSLLRILRQRDRLLKWQIYSLILQLTGWLTSVFLMFYAVDAAASLLPVNVGWWRYLFAAVLAWSLTEAFLAPIAIIALAQGFAQMVEESPAPPDADVAQWAASSPAFARLWANRGE